MKTPQQKKILREYGCRPFFWKVAEENGHFIMARNWLTGEFRICRK